MANNSINDNSVFEVFPSNSLGEVDGAFDIILNRSPENPDTPPETPDPPPEDPGDDTPPEIPEAVPGAVYRLFNVDTGVHLYTADVAERDSIILNLDNYEYEGIAYFTAQTDGGIPVYRFYEPNLDIYLYTASQAERNNIEDNLPNYTFQGESYTVFESQVGGTVPVYRFRTDSGAFFYTANETERENIVNNLPNFTFEGVAFYGYDENPGDNPNPDDPTPPPENPNPNPDPNRTGFNGAELTYQEFSPDLDTPFGDPFNIVVGDGVELDIADGELGENGAGTVLDLDNGTLIYTIDTELAPSTFSPAEFNGFIIADLTDNLPTITNVTIDPASTLAVDTEDVVFIDDALAVNVESVPFADGDTLILDVDFAEPGTEPDPPNEPEPPSEPPTSNGGNFTGAEIQYQVFFPDFDSPVGDSLFATVGDGAEFIIPPSPDDDTSVGETIDITGNSILYEVTEPNGGYTEGEFNGIVLADTADNLPDITNVTIDSANTTLGIDSSDIVFIEDAISINLEGLSYVTGDTFKLDVEFADV